MITEQKDQIVQHTPGKAENIATPLNHEVQDQIVANKYAIAKAESR